MRALERDAKSTRAWDVRAKIAEKAGDTDDFVYALSDNGQLIFRFNLGRDVDSSPVIDSRGTLLVGADDGSLYALR